MCTLYKFHFLSEINQLFEDYKVIRPAPVYTCLIITGYDELDCSFMLFYGSMLLHVCTFFSWTKFQCFWFISYFLEAALSECKPLNRLADNQAILWLSCGAQNDTVDPDLLKLKQTVNSSEFVHYCIINYIISTMISKMATDCSKRKK